MAVAYDAFTKSSQFLITPDPFTFAHTPTGTPRGVAVLIAQNPGASSPDAIAGVTYGGVAMTRIVTAVDTATEPGRTYAYFLGASIPTGTQTVSIDIIDVDPAFPNKVAVCVTLTASADTEVADSAIVEGDATNPAVTLDAGTATGIALGVLYTGINTTAPAEQTGNTNITTHDFGSATRFGTWARQTTPATGTHTIGWTATIDDAALSAIMVVESATSAMLDPLGASGFFGA